MTYRAAIPVLLFLHAAVPAEDAAPTGLMCELLAHPERTTITDSRPDFSWIVNPAQPGATQTARRILVAADEKTIRAPAGDRWDSGAVASSRSVCVEYAGKPLEPGKTYWWRVQTRVGNGAFGPWSRPQQFTMAPAAGRAETPSPLGDSRWIWYPEKPAKGTRYFRRTVAVPAGKIARARFLVTVDDNFTLYVNGEKRAATTEHNAWKRFRDVDIAAALKPGTHNAVAVAAVNTGDAAGFTGTIAIEMQSGTTVSVPVDTTWKTSREAPAGWLKADFDDGSWKKPADRGAYGTAPWKTTATIPRPRTAGKAPAAPPNRYLPVKTLVRPQKVIRIAEDHYYVDFGRAAFGTIRLTLDAPAACTVGVHLGEEKVPGKNRVNRTPGGTRRYRKMDLDIGKGEGAYTVTIAPDRRNTGSRAIRMPPAVGEVMPFRYCEITNCPAAIDAGAVRQVAVHYPFNDEAAEFHSSDPTLNAVWDLCKYSMKATSFCGVYVDGDRERIPYEADAYINQLCHYCTDREFTLARYTHEYLIDHPTWPTEWALHSVLMAWADYMHTGDPESMAARYADLKAKTLRALAGPDGLISLSRFTPAIGKTIHIGKLRDIVDWPKAERDGYVMAKTNTVVNAFHYRALVLFSRIARALDKNTDAADFAAAAASVRDTINRRLFDEKRGRYVDGLGTDHASLHASMFPLAFGIVPPDGVESVLAFITSKGMACSVYGAQYLMEALYRAGADEYALSLLRSRDARSWWNMIREGSTITMEAWGNRFKGNQDWNHAWGGVPANAIPRLLMGVTPAAPGFRRIRIRPQPGTLREARLKLPTIRGTVTVAFERKDTDNNTLELAVTIPGNTTADVHVPLDGAKNPAVAVDGNPAKGTRDGDFLVLEDIGPGKHVFTRTGG